MTDLMGGQIDLFCANSCAMNNIRSQSVRRFWVTGSERLDQPALPTLREVGISDADMAVWHGLFAPAGTPEAIVKALDGALSEALDDRIVSDRFKTLSVKTTDPHDRSPGALGIASNLN